MRLSDIVGHSTRSSSFAQIALIIAIGGFIGVVVYLLLRRNRKTFDRAKMMPLDDEQVQTPRDGPGNDAANPSAIEETAKHEQG